MHAFLFEITTLILGVYADVLHLSPEYVYVMENTSVTLTCSRENGQLVESQWTNSQFGNELATVYYNGERCITTRFLSNSNLLKGVCNGDGTYSVLLKRVERTQFGSVWECREALAFSNKVTINKIVPVAKVDIYPPAETHMKENHSQAIRCKTSPCRPQPTIRWVLSNPIDRTEYNITRNTTQISSDNGAGLVVMEGLLYLLPNRSLNGWVLKCKAWNNNQSPAVISKEVVLNISFPPDGPPVITGAQNGSKYQVAEHEVAHLSCSVTGGNPLAHIDWLCLGGHTSDATESNIVTSSIVWTALRNQQNASCVCVAEHAFGNTITSVTVDILYKASVLHFYIGEESTEKNTFTVSENNTITFTCITDSKPPPNVTVSHNGRIIHVSVSKNSLKITRKHAQCSDIGIYVCSAMNKYNNDKPSFGNLTLNVICSPRPYPFFEPIENVSSPIHTSATLRFSALAFPEPGPPGFTWYYLINGTERIMLTNTHNVVISSLSSHTSLTIRNVTVSKYGEYVLNVTNVIGVYEQKFSLKPFSSTPCSNIVANSTSTVAIVAVGAGTSLATLLFVGSILFVHRFMRRKSELLQNVLSNHGHKEENEPTSTDSGTITEYEQISMKTVTVSESTEQNKESIPGTSQNYSTLDKSRKEANTYSQLSALHQQQKISRTKTEGAPVDNSERQHASKDYINIKI